MSEKRASQKSKPNDLEALIPALAKDCSLLECSSKLGLEIRKAREATFKASLARTKKGLQNARALAKVTDAAINGLFMAGKSLYPEESEHMAIVAVGGYGRGSLAPYSDIDILILHRPYSRQKVKPLLDFILYALWDAGLAVAQSVHSAASAVAFAKQDLAGNTSFLDARFLIGHEPLFEEFFQRYEKHRKQTVHEFIAAKMEERDQRLVEAASSRYHVEPDVKEGKGGLRDLQALHWLASYVYGGRRLQEHFQDGVLSEEETASFEKALSFLWSVRIQIHCLRGRADDKLSFDIQPEIARALGYQDRARMPAAERLMKHYFVTTKEVGRLTGIVSATLEEAQVKKPRLLIPPLFHPRGKKRGQIGAKAIRSDELGDVNDFCMRGDRLDFRDHEKALEDPVQLFRLFRIAGRKPACEIHPAALKVVADAVSHLDRSIQKNEKIRILFRAIVTDNEAPQRSLRAMAEAGLLGKYIPVFGKLIGRVKYGLYRLYTLDEHVLKSVGVLARAAQGFHNKDYPITARLAQNARDLFPLFLAIFLHESIEATPHLERKAVEKEVRQSIKYLLDTEEEIETVTWAVMNYRLMADTAVRRNLMEPNVVRQFCEQVGSQERLDYILVLTVCRLTVIGFNSWDSWTRRDLTVLYDAASVWFANGEEGLEKLFLKRQQDLRNKTARKLADWSVPELERFFSRMTPVFFEGVSSVASARFARMVREADQSVEPGAVSITPLDDNLIEVMVYSRDKPGLYAAIAGVIASLGGEVRASTAFPVKSAHKGPDMAANVFIFSSHEEQPLVAGPDDHDGIRKLRDSFGAVLARSPDMNFTIKTRFGDRRSVFEVKSEVILDAETSEDALIVEARGLDRPGLLYKLASALSEVGVSIRAAYVATYGEVAVDTFYVQDLPGYKITEKRRQEVIKRRLLAVLNDH